MFHSLLLLSLVFLVAGAAVLVTAAFLMAQGLLRPPRMSDGKAVYVLQRLSPGDLDMHFSEVRFSVRDASNPRGESIDIAAWWIQNPAAGNRCVVMLPGYADAKVGVIAWAPTWQALGYHILAIDLRAHGESGGHNCTAGFFERHDVNEVINRLRVDHPAETEQLVLFGVSLGAAVAIATAALREDVAAIVLDSPFADYHSAVRSHARRLGLPTGITCELAMWMAQRIAGADFSVVRPSDLLPQVACSVMVIRGERDEFVPPEDLQALDRAMANRANSAGDVTWIAPNAGHLAALRSDPQGYAHHLSRFAAALSPDLQVPIA